VTPAITHTCASCNLHVSTPRRCGAERRGWGEVTTRALCAVSYPQPPYCVCVSHQTSSHFAVLKVWQHKVRILSLTETSARRVVKRTTHGRPLLGRQPPFPTPRVPSLVGVTVPFSPLSPGTSHHWSPRAPLLPSVLAPSAPRAPLLTLRVLSPLVTMSTPAHQRDHNSPCHAHPCAHSSTYLRPRGHALRQAHQGGPLSPCVELPAV
jgi:hypothetical protein